jgi:hypothetical protein
MCANSAIVGSYLYIWNDRYNSIVKALIRQDNSSGAFAVVPDVTLMTARVASSAMLGNYLYALWGLNGSDNSNNVE